MDPRKDLQQLEALLDSKPSPRKSSVDGTSSTLRGWSPQRESTQAPTGLDADMHSLSLGASAHSSLNSGSQHQSRSANEGRPPTAEAAGGFAKKPKLSKQERRELQEKQRAAKFGSSAPAAKTAGTAAATKASTAGSSNVSGGAIAHENSSSADTPREAARSSSSSRSDPHSSGKMLQLFSHLADYRKGKETAASGSGHVEIHPAIAALGQRYASGDVRGANARAVALLAAFREVVRDYSTPPDKMLSWDLDKKLKPQIQFLIDCRPHSVSMGNAIKFMRNAVAKVPPEMGEAAAKAHIYEKIDSFIDERIVIAGDSIAEHGNCKISDGDVLLTFGSSSLVKKVLRAAWRSGKRFRVVAVDSRPAREGRCMAAALAAEGIPVTYILLGAVSYIMREVTKVFLGASALMANGAVLSRVGTAVVAMMARSYGAPVCFCCETYKFCERVQLDSIVSNELGHPEELLEGGGTPQELADWDAIPALKLLNLRYDLTPIKYVDLVITEIGIIPPTSVPVLLREMNVDKYKLDSAEDS